MGDSLELSAIHGSREIAANKMPHKPAYSSAVMSLKLIVLWERHWMYINLVIYEVLGTVLSTVNMLNTVILPKTITCVLSYSLDRWETEPRGEVACLRGTHGIGFWTQSDREPRSLIFMFFYFNLFASLFYWFASMCLWGSLEESWSQEENGSRDSIRESDFYDSKAKIVKRIPVCLLAGFPLLTFDIFSLSLSVCVCRCIFF